MIERRVVIKCAIGGVLLIFVLLFGGQVYSLAGGSYDGHWWLLLTMEEKSGYLNGDADCNHFELGTKPLYSKSAVESEEYITNYYRNNPTKRSASVFEVARSSDAAPPLAKTPGDGESWHGRHGYWDGQWWREGTPADRLGFVEGYLGCLAQSKSPKYEFHRAPAEYVKLINQWYRLNEETADIDPSRETDKIADVLFKFGDKPNPAK